MGRGKRIVEDDDEGAGGSAGNKAPKVDGGQADEESVTVCELSKTRKISVRKWKGQVLVDIREYWYKGTQCLPGKKGISLTMEQWNALVEHADAIDSAIKSI